MIAIPVSFDDELRYLRHHAWHPAQPEVIDTHLSCVFLVGDLAYKLKRPILMPYLDNRTVEARHRECDAEVELNHALAPGVYLGTVPVTRDRGGRLHIGGPGEVIDWLVVMRRLDRAAMLDQRLTRGELPLDAEVNALVVHLVGFYQSTTSQARTPREHRRRLIEAAQTDRAELLADEHHLDRREVTALVDGQLDAIDRFGELDDRASRIVEGHGDLRPEHVTFVPGPLIIDRLSFDRRLRLVDPVDDLALLSVECRSLGTASVGDQITAAYLRRAGDPASPAVVALYRSLRASTRARLSIAHLHDGPDHQGRWTTKTLSYLAIASDELGRCSS
jgi:uncharacterized protein